jgi:hypothetical protein
MARPKTGTPTKQAPKNGTQIAFRADDDLLALIDRAVEQTRTERPGLTVTRAEVARDLIYQALKGSRAK